MSEKLGEWVHKKYHKPDPDYAYSISIGYRRFKVRVSLDKANADTLKALLMGDSPKLWDRLLDLTVDVWGGAGPDCRIQPVLAGT